jgi:hypothetical protein
VLNNKIKTFGITHHTGKQNEQQCNRPFPLISVLKFVSGAGLPYGELNFHPTPYQIDPYRIPVLPQPPWHNYCLSCGN